MDKDLKDLLKNFDRVIYPDTFIPIYQILSALLFGLFFGPFHNAFIWSLVSYGIFEYILYIATRKRPRLYSWRIRIIAILFSIGGILFSKFIWGDPKIPLFKFLLQIENRINK